MTFIINHLYLMFKYLNKKSVLKCQISNVKIQTAMAAAAALSAQPNRLISTASVALLHLLTKLKSPFFPTRQLWQRRCTAVPRASYRATEIYINWFCLVTFSGWFSLVMDTCLAINQSVSRSRIDISIPILHLSHSHSISRLTYFPSKTKLECPFM